MYETRTTFRQIAGLSLVGLLATSVDGVAATRSVEARVEFISRSSIAEVQPVRLQTYDQDSDRAIVQLTAPGDLLSDGDEAVLAERRVKTELTVQANRLQHGEATFFSGTVCIVAGE